jgi:benzoate-CoA ligase family protein
MRPRCSMNFNVGAELVERNLRAGRGEAPAIWSGGRAMSYQEVAARVDRIGAALLRAGVQPEQRVLFVLQDSPDLACAYLAAMKIGAVAVPCNPLLRAADYQYFLEESRAALAITSTACLERVQPALPKARKALVCGVDFEKFVDETPAQKLPAAPTSPDEPAFWLWTSGSTGRPKAAVHAHQDWPHCCDLYSQPILALTPEDRCFSASKLFHAYGLGNALIFPFWAGASTALSPALTFKMLAEARPTVFFGVPTLYAAMLAQADAPKELPQVRLCVSAGEPLPGQLFTRWKERYGVEILDGIGSTEVLHIYVSPRRGSAKADSTGTPVEGYEVRIVDEHLRDVPEGAAGDLIVRGPSTALHYWNRLAQSRAKMRGEWFFSGDKFRRTPDGELHYVGRSDDMFKCGGEWVSPTDVEAALASHTAVLEAAVTPHGTEGLLKVQAHVVLIEGRTATAELEDELRAVVKARCAGYMVPRVFRFLPELPKTASGKIQRYLLRGQT